MKTIKKTLLAIALAGAFTNANAIPVDWTLNNVSISLTSTYTFTGSFTYDADTNTYSNFNVIFSTMIHPLYGTSIVNEVEVFHSGDASGFKFHSPGNTYVHSVSFLSLLTNQGGDVQLNSSGIWSSEYPARVTGYLTGVPQTPKATAVPEPEAYAMMLAGLGLVGFAARRKLS